MATTKRTGLHGGLARVYRWKVPVTRATLTKALRPGQVVRYAHPGQGEADLTFVVIEDNGNRILIESRDFPDWHIPPREVVAPEELVVTHAGGL